MIRTAQALLLLLATIAAGPLAQAQGPGTTLPAFELQDLSQTEATSLSQYHGRVLLLEFFAFWCGPCALSVPHLNELQEKFGARGLSVVAVTREGPERTVPWVQKKGVRYAYGYDPRGAMHSFFEIDGIPFSALVDSQGTILWSGHPARLTDARIEAALAGALEQPIWTWPEAQRGLAEPLWHGDYATALQVAGALEAGGETGAVARVRERIEAQLARLEAARKAGDPRGALRVGRKLLLDLKGLPEADRVGERVRELEADPETARLLAAQQRLDALEGELAAARFGHQLGPIRERVAALAADFPGTQVERQARTLEREIDALIERTGKKK